MKMREEHRLSNILDASLLKEMLDAGHIRFAVHPEYPELRIYGYSQSAQFDRVWNGATNACRGLITVTNEDGEFVLARGFNKFHNINTEYIEETLEANLPHEEPMVTSKMDGSLGIIFYYDNLWHVATRGSFASDQAKWATAFFRKNVDVVAAIGLTSFVELYTPVVEIIYVENRIVVGYDFEGLIVLGLIDKETGLDHGRGETEAVARILGLPVVKLHNKDLQTCMSENIPNEEGYVLTFDNGLKIKVKFEDYCKLHRIVTGLNPKTVWEMMSGYCRPTSASEEAPELHGTLKFANMVKDETLPEQFRNWLSNWTNQFLTDLERTRARAVGVVLVGETQYGSSRKDLATFFTNADNRDIAGICFAMLDKKSAEAVDWIIWKMIKPKATDTFRIDGGRRWICYTTTAAE